MSFLDDSLQQVKDAVATAATTFANQQLQNVAAANGATIKTPTPQPAAALAGPSMISKITPSFILGVGIVGLLAYKLMKKGRV